jgi:hypothetical protein
VAFVTIADLLRRAANDDFAALVARIGAKIDNPVSAFDHFQIVLDDQERIAGFDKSLEHFEQDSHVFEVQPGGRLIKDEQRGAAFLEAILRDLGEVANELEALAFASREAY